VIASRRARAALERLATERARKAARIAELRCGKGAHLLLTLLEDRDGFLVVRPPGRMPRPHVVARRMGVVATAEQRAWTDERAWLITPELMAEVRATGSHERVWAVGAQCRCSEAGAGLCVPVAYLADIAAAGRGQGTVIADPERVRSPRDPYSV
jgi:hypothetical protein